MPEISRVILIVLDSVGIGALPDASNYGDEGTNTLGHIATRLDLKLPNLGALGLGWLITAPSIPPVTQPEGAFGKMAEQSTGKDTTTGHWEIAGLILEQPFPTFPHGFPTDLIQEYEKRIGRPTIGNKVASGTEIIAELGADHLQTGYPIVYTSADSVFQIAAHEEIIPVEQLYDFCKIARSMLSGPYAVGRVIARPFVGQPGAFQRTARRHDFSLKPTGPVVLETLAAAGKEVRAIGKINDIFAGVGITGAVSTASNQEGVDWVLAALSEDFQGLVFVNLVEFDMLYGHRNNPAGYAAALAEFDARLPEIRARLRPGDVLIITADHGCDPTTPGTDHTREYVPILVTGAAVKPGVDLGVRETFSDVAATIAGLLQVTWNGPGRNMAGEFLQTVPGT